MEELKEKLVQKFKILKPFEDDKQDVVEFAIETAIYDVMNFCHFEIEDFPEQLYHTTVLIALELVNQDGYLLSPEEVEEASVTSLSEGDFSIGKVSKADIMQKIISAPSFSRKYAKNLVRFRRLG